MKKSILKTSSADVSNLMTVQERKDTFGTMIESQKKNHKIKIAEEENKEIVVENWKEYNVDTSQEDPCVCNLI